MKEKLCHQNDCIRNQLTEHIPPLWRQEKGNELTRLNVEPNNHYIAFNSCKVYNSLKSCNVWRNIFAVSTSHLQLNSTWNARMSHRIMAERRQGVMQKKYQSSLTTQAHPCTLVEEVAGLVFLSINREKVQLVFTSSPERNGFQSVKLVKEHCQLINNSWVENKGRSDVFTFKGVIVLKDKLHETIFVHHQVHWYSMTIPSNQSYPILSMWVEQKWN